MANYKKLYSFFLYGVDDALTLLDHGETERAKELLQQLLLDVEENVVSRAPLPPRKIPYLR